MESTPNNNFFIGGEMENLYQIPARGSCSMAERERLWKQIIADQERSGLKMTRFCQKHQLTISTFKQWKYRLQKDSEQFDKNDVLEDAHVSKSTTEFIPLQVTTNNFATTENGNEAQGQAESETEIKIIFRNGHSIIIPLAVSAEVLSSLIYQIAKLPC